MRALVVVPTYFEVENIATLLAGVEKHLPDADVVVVDDNSTDGTVEIVEEAAAVNPHIRLLKRPGKQGLGAAYRAGLGLGLDEGYDILVEMDADLSHDPSYLPELVSAAAHGADLVIGSRYVPGGHVVGWPRHRWWLSRWGNRYAAFALGLALNDSTSGYRAYRAEALRAIDVSSVGADGFAFQIEMAYRIVKQHGRVVEIPIVFHDRVAGSSKMSSAIVREALLFVTVRGVLDALTWRRSRRAYGRSQ
jgi:glycosyltransferase involved in cell wall biosynthesis